MLADSKTASSSAPEVFVVAAPYGAALRLFRDVDWLDDSERERIRKYVGSVDRDRYRAAHMMVRAVLSASLGKPPQSLRFTAQEFGKPVLDGLEGWDFNLSHGGGWVAVACGRGLKVGIDVAAFNCLENFFMLADCGGPFCGEHV